MQSAQKCIEIKEAYVDEEETPLKNKRSQSNYDFTTYVEKYNARTLRAMISEVSGKELAPKEAEEQK